MVLSVCIYILMYQRSFENQVSVDVPIRHVISNDWPIIRDNMSYRHIYRDLIIRYPFSSLNIQVVMATCLMFLIYSPDMSATYHANNRDISQIPQCTNSISHYTPFCYRNVHICAHFCYKMLHCVIFDWCIMGFVRWLYWVHGINMVWVTAGPLPCIPMLCIHVRPAYQQTYYGLIMNMSSIKLMILLKTKHNKTVWKCYGI